MSTGYGSVQQRIRDVARASGEWLSLPELAAEVYGVADCSEAQIVAVRRAIRRMISEGRLETKGGGHGRRRYVRWEKNT